MSQTDLVFHPTTAADYEEVLKNAGSKPVFIDFFAEWCGPCHMVAPIVEKLAKEYEGKVVVMKVDTDKLNTIAAAFGIMSIPTIVILKNGEEVGQKMSGVKPEQVYRQAIDAALAA
jgi:thioredoxin 1